jgi:hypothetical protein
MDKIGKAIIFFGVTIIIIGFIIWLAGDKLKFLGRLPGDIRIERENYRVYIPITTMILVSLLFSLILWLIQKFR